MARVRKGFAITAVIITGIVITLTSINHHTSVDRHQSNETEGTIVLIPGNIIHNDTAVHEHLERNRRDAEERRKSKHHQMSARAVSAYDCSAPINFRRVTGRQTP
jgi:hypothetical protein